MDATADEKEVELGGQMSFMEHLDELRRRLINSVVIIIIAFCICFYFSANIYNFLEKPVIKALAEARETKVPPQGKTGDANILPINSLKEGEKGRYVFDKNASFGEVTVKSGTAVSAVVERNEAGEIGLYTEEPIFTRYAVVPKGIKLPIDLTAATSGEPYADTKMIVTTAVEPFTLYVTVSLYAAICLSIPFLLLQIWSFISPALYQHEKRYVTPFILLSTISFVVGAAFAYYILFPPAVTYLLGVGSEFDIMLKATEYFDFITLIMLAMGIIFQMPAITYVLARIGIITAGLLVKVWKMALVIILIVAAVVSPTGDIPNLLLFAAPMMLLYLISIFVAWFFGKKRTTEAV